MSLDRKNHIKVLQDELVASYNTLQSRHKIANKIFISDIQTATAKEIVTEFLENDKRLITLIAQPQWGKTGCVVSTAYQLCTHTNTRKLVYPENVFILTGLCDKEWELQTKSRMLPQFRDGVYHRGLIPNIAERLKTISNALVVIDECHYASSTNQTITNVFKEAGLLDIDRLNADNIYILQTSATPDNVLVDSKSWGDFHATISPSADETASYTSFKTFMNNDRIKETVDLTDASKVEDLFNDILSFDSPRYHIIRIPRKGSANNSKQEIISNIQAFCEDYSCELLQHHSKKKITDIDQMLHKRPEQHTIILVVDYWRAAKTLPDFYLGVVHERLVNKPSSTTVIQSLAGRCVGHNKRVKDGVIIYTHLKSIEQYIQLCDNNFDYQETKYYSTGISTNGDGKITLKQSYAYECNGIDHQYVESKNNNQICWKLFFGTSTENAMEEASEFVKEYISTKLPVKRINSDGFYVQNDRDEPLYVYEKYFRDDKPFNKRIFKGLSGINAKKKTNWRQYALYRDPTDVNSLIWFICWRKVVYPNAPGIDN